MTNPTHWVVEPSGSLLKAWRFNDSTFLIEGKGKYKFVSHFNGQIFTNYWHAYAYQQRLLRQRKEVK